MRFLPIGPRTLLVELNDLDQTLALFDALHAPPLTGVAEIVPAARTLMIRTVPGVAAGEHLAARIAARQPAPGTTRVQGSVETIEIPASYDGEDMADVARHMGLSEAEVIAAHQAATWQVAFCGFAPGFAYMTGDDQRFNLPRRAAPRARIPAGSVALASRYCGIYPQDTPGGWQLIGTTKVPMWDLSRDPPALLRPGARVRFVEGRAEIYASVALPQPATAPVLTLLASAFPVLFQDEGRAGHVGQGVSASGALDIGALRRANRAVGNPADAAALELTLGPTRLRAAAPITLALTGAGRASVDGRDTASGTAFALNVGDEMTIDLPVAGMRSYLALRGGFDVAPVLGSCSTDTLAAVGPDLLKPGAILGCANRQATAVTEPEAQPALPKTGELLELPVTLGPRTDWFSPEMVTHFLSQDWLVTPQSSRVGIRLHGATPLSRANTIELPSEGTETGAIQVPHSGQPVLFLADHPLTGGYPVIATLLPAALDLAGQIPPGARIRFVATVPFAPIIPARPA